MILGIIKTLFMLLMAAPFLYIVVDVFVDISKRMFGFFRAKTKPVMISINSAFNKF